MNAPKKKQSRLPHPRVARLAAGLTWRQMAASADVSQDTISKCEKSGAYPRNRHVRISYLRALGLVEVARA